ncbi:MarR family winged helix-turn-helix transcriptional regulator [Roseomonas populi]|uniref:MarR family winged helix-turn-helix transcriptional regulator n=1 Tax=Roseomonas populi TaxID=3121582 RepID=A0ABT1X9G5_9PROT|nr:MarR family winged helix-turn-helix transcriptional regulator [Roseomonas pecuniae]MCR0983777.1 MarR family winged helix-turn-helix transcriptional regulator [Roseomonas pecuniae]
MTEPKRRRAATTGQKMEAGTVALTVSLPEMLQDGTDHAFRETVFGLVQALGYLQACRDAFGRAMGLTGSQFAVLVGVGHCQGENGTSIRAIADHVQMAATHVTTEVGRLLRRGLLLKRPNPEDRRGVLVSLSARGNRAVTEVAPFMRMVNDHLFAGYTAADIEALNRFVRRFHANGEAALAAIRGVESETPRRARRIV